MSLYLPDMEKSEKLSRNQFLKKLGFSGASLFAVYCLGVGTSSCSVEQTNGTDTDFSLDISKGKFRQLAQKGGWIKVRNVIVAKTGDNSFTAVTSICSHEGENEIEFRAETSDFRCRAHGAEFDLGGKGKNKKGRKGLALYQAELTGNILRVTLPTNQNQS